MIFWLLLFLAGCAAVQPVPVEKPVLIEAAEKPADKYYLCEPGDNGRFMIIGTQVFLVIIRPDGSILDKCAIPGGREIIVMFPDQQT